MTLKSLSEPEFTNETVARYYRETWWHYRGLWTGRHTLALHYAYWDDGVRTHAEGLHRLNDVLATRVAIGPDDRVLDAGCGWGGSSIWLVQHRGARVHGITITPEQVAKAQEKARVAGVEGRTEFSLEDYHTTSFLDASFDVVWAIESVCYSRDKSRFCAEAFRVLKPGGRLVLGDFFRARRDQDPKSEHRLRHWFRQWVIDDLDTRNEFRAALAGAGFDAIEIEDATARILPAARRLFRLGVAMMPIAGLLRLVGLHSDLQHGNWKSSLLQYLTVRRGLWNYGIVSAHKPPLKGAP